MSDIAKARKKGSHFWSFFFLEDALGKKLISTLKKKIFAGKSIWKFLKNLKLKLKRFSSVEMSKSFKWFSFKFFQV